MTDLKNLIVVDITDYENTVLIPSDIGATGEHVIKEIKARGTILVKNTSQKSRLWNLTCDLKEVVNTNLNKVLDVGSVSPNQEFKQDYETQNLKEPCLKVVEIFDVERDISGTVNNVFLYENANKCNLKFAFTNTLDIPITEITLARELPEIFQDIDIKTPNVGTAEQTEEEGKKIVRWKIQGLGAKETSNLEIYFTVIAKERKDYPLGPLKVNYLIDNKILTMITPEVRGETDSMSGVTRDEGSNPGIWDCNVEFINDSEFRVRLEDVKVTHKIPTGAEMVVSETPNQELDPDTSWDKNFPIESVNVPELESEIAFTPLFGVITRVIGEIIKEPTYYHVLSAEVHKAINPPEVAAYANTDMTIVNTIPNKGTSNINTLEILDEIPLDFVPPLIKEVKIEVKTPEKTLEIQERAEFAAIDINPEDQNPETKHTIDVKLKDLEKQLPPNAEIIMSYPLLAKNPKPEVRYNTPIEIRANDFIKGKEFIISPPEEPVVKIKYVARKLKTLKSVKPGAKEGDFNISVRIQNKGEVELENIIVKDKIPAGFTLSEFTPPEGATHEILEKGEETELEVKIPMIKGGVSTNINYTCSGSGDYSRTEPTVTVLGRTGSAPKTEPNKTISTYEPEETIKPSQLMAAQVHEIFSEIFKQVDIGISTEKLSDLLDENKDNLPPGPAHYQLMQYATELKGMGDKAIVGDLKDEVIAKLNEMKSMYD